MASQTENRTRLLLGSGAAALAASLALMPQQAAAQAIQATPDVVVGNALIDRNTPGLDVITAETRTVVIDWTPDEISGTALDFLPTGATAIFQNNVQVITDFAILNRILPSTNGDIVVIDGTVISRLDQGNGFGPGGFVAFYSPTGILVGSNAVFDVGGLMLTALAPDLATFSTFLDNGQLSLSGSEGSIAPILIRGGATIGATPENSFFIVAGPQIVMDGTAFINGSTAYVAGLQVDLTFSNGLFDIVVPLGTSVTNAIEHNGTTGGPASTGVGDNHVIYGVTKAEINPVQMLFRGNLGFEPALVAGVDNGDIILAANFEVFGRTVNGGSIDQGLDAIFADNAQTSAVEANIILDQFTGTSNLLAIGTHTVQALAAGGASSQTGNLLVVAGEFAEVQATGGLDFVIDGDVLVSATDYGLITEGNGSPPILAANGGSALITANNGGNIAITGSALVSADAFAGYDFILLVGGAAQGGDALIGASEGTLRIDGNATVSAIASGPAEVALISGGTSDAGLAQYFATLGGQASIGGDLMLIANAFGADVSAGGSQAGTAATGGSAFLNVLTGGGSASVDGSVSLAVNAVAGPGNGSGTGATGTGGHAAISADVANATIAIGGSVDMRADGIGSDNEGGLGGTGIGGRSRVSTFGGDVTIAGAVATQANALGGAGLNGGSASGGIAGVFALIGSIDIDGSVSAAASAVGGNAAFGSGGQGGSATGGNAFVQAEGTLTENASIVIGGDFSAVVDAFGGTGGVADASGIPAGAGGVARGGVQNIPVPSDPQFFGGAFALAQGDRGSLQIDGNTTLSSTGFGGQGGSGFEDFDGGIGGDGFGGTAQAGLFIGTGNGSVSQGSAQFGAVSVSANGIGGNGGIAPLSDDPSGTGGAGFGGGAFFTARLSTAIADQVALDSSGTGGLGGTGGQGVGGNSGLLTTNGGTAQLAALFAVADGVGAASLDGAGAAGTGGTAFIGFQGGTTQIASDVLISASGFGGDGIGGNGGAGEGGTADIANFVAVAGTATIGGSARVIASGLGGDALSAGFTGGTGTGGEAYLLTQTGGTLQVNTVQVLAGGLGGSGPSANGGAGTGGIAYIESRDTGSSVTVQNTAGIGGGDIIDQSALVGAIGAGGLTTGGAGIGGTGTGGEAIVRASGGGAVNLPLTGGPAAFARILARGHGGQTTVDGGTGGTGTGGTIRIEALDSGSLTVGPLQLSAFGEGGSSANAAANIDGGDGIGGARLITVANAGTLTASIPAGIAGGSGGNGSGTGNGGNASGGVASLGINGGTANLAGTSIIATQNIGGNGVTGGSASGGVSSLQIQNGGVLNILPDVSGVAQLSVSNLTFGGNGTTGNGGSSTAQSSSALIESGTVSGGNLTVQSTATGGASISGIGGQAQGGSATLLVDAANVGLVSVTVSGVAQGGLSDSGAHGDAFGGNAAIALIEADYVTSGLTRLTTTATSGTGSASPANSGVAVGGSSFLDVSGGAAMAVGSIEILSGGLASNGGSASGGASGAGVASSQVTTGTLLLDSTASAIGGTSAAGGEAALFGQGGGSLQADSAAILTGASGAASNFAGSAAIEVAGAAFDFTTLEIASIGTDGGSVTLLNADGGGILIQSTADIQSTGNVEAIAVNGGIIGGPTVSNPTAAITIFTPGTISFAGNNDNAISFGGALLLLTSGDLDIGAGARIGANLVEITSLDTQNVAILGGTTEGPGYTLTAAEIERIEAGEATFIAPLLDQASANAPDLILRDMFLAGSLDDGTSLINVRTPGTMRVEGVVAYVDTSVEDRLVIEAGERIEIVTPGGIGVLGPGDAPGGELVLRASDIWAADAATISRLQDNLTFEGRNDLLATAASGSDDPLGYLRAGTMQLIAGRSLLVRNTGTSSEPGGILVGEGGLSINGRFDDGDPSLLDVFAYGRRQNSDGTFVVGAAFYELVNFNRVGDVATSYLDGSKFNDCDINTGECDQVSIDIIDLLPPLNNPVIIDLPVSKMNQIPPAEDETDSKFGIDFPGLVEAPLLSQDALIEDPVTSGGDSSLYAVDDDDENHEGASDEE